QKFLQVGEAIAIGITGGAVVAGRNVGVKLVGEFPRVEQTVAVDVGQWRAGIAAPWRGWTGLPVDRVISLIRIDQSLQRFASTVCVGWPGRCVGVSDLVH